MHSNLDAHTHTCHHGVCVLHRTYVLAVMGVQEETHKIAPRLKHGKVPQTLRRMVLLRKKTTSQVFATASFSFCLKIPYPLAFGPGVTCIRSVVAWIACFFGCKINSTSSWGCMNSVETYWPILTNSILWSHSAWKKHGPHVWSVAPSQDQPTTWTLTHNKLAAKHCCRCFHGYLMPFVNFGNMLRLPVPPWHLKEEHMSQAKNLLCNV